MQMELNQLIMKSKKCIQDQILFSEKNKSRRVSRILFHAFNRMLIIIYLPAFLGGTVNWNTMTNMIIRFPCDLPGDIGRNSLHASPYLILLPVGFSIPRNCSRATCALTARFHPYVARRRHGLFSVPLSVVTNSHPPRPNLYARSVSSGTASYGVRTFLHALERGDYPVCFIFKEHNYTSMPPIYTLPLQVQDKYPFLKYPLLARQRKT